MATIEIVNPRTASRRNLGINWYRVRNLMVFLAVFLVCLVLGVVASYLWPVNYTSRVLVTAPHPGLLGDLNRAATMLGANADVLTNAAQLDAGLRVTPQDLLTEFGMVYASSDSLRNFYVDGQLYQLDGLEEADLNLQFLRAVGSFVASFTYSQTSVAGVNALELEFTDARAETAAEILNNYVNYSADLAVRNLRQAQLAKRDQVLLKLGDYLQLENIRRWPRRIAAIKGLQSQIRGLSIEARQVRPVRLVSQATAELARPTPERWTIIAWAAAAGLVLSLMMLLLLERRDHQDQQERL